MLDRFHSYPNAKLRRAARDFVRANSTAISTITIGTLIYAAVITWLVDGYLAGLLAGLVVSLMTALIGLTFLLVSGATSLLSGSLGESNTADELRIAKRRGLVFGNVNNLRIEGADVDHIVVSPGGLLAIDSKWHSHGVDDDLLERDARAASAAGLHARSILRSVQVRRPQVRQIVVVWGGDQDAVAGQFIDDVEFVAGRDFRAWLQTNASTGKAYNATQAEGLLLDLVAFKRRVRPKQEWQPKPVLQAATAG